MEIFQRRKTFNDSEIQAFYGSVRVFDTEADFKAMESFNKDMADAKRSFAKMESDALKSGSFLRLG